MFFASAVERRVLPWLGTAFVIFSVRDSVVRIAIAADWQRSASWKANPQSMLQRKAEVAIELCPSAA
jgi:hypothetical protein